MQFDPYDVMGLGRDADLGSIRARYRALSKTHHPDVGGDRAKWDLLGLAHAILTDEERRARYDATGVMDELNPDVDYQQACVLIAEQFASAADQFVRKNFDPVYDPRSSPVIATIEVQIRKELNDAEAALLIGRAQLDFVRDFTKRLTRREGISGVDQIAAIMRQKISSIEQQIVHVEGVVRVRKLALEVLADYSFEGAADNHARTFTMFMS